MPSQVPGSKHGAAGPFVLLSSALALVRSFPCYFSDPFLLEWECLSVQYTLEVYSFLSILQELTLKRLPRVAEKTSVLGVGTVKASRTYEGGLHFCIMR